MGQEASVPRNNGASSADNDPSMNHQAPPQGGRFTAPNNNNTADHANAVDNRVVNPSISKAASVGKAASGGGGRGGIGLGETSSGLMSYHQPQSQRHAAQMMTGAPPPPPPPLHPQQQHPASSASQQHQQQQQGQGSSSSSSSLMSRAGLTSMIQRIGGNSSRTAQTAMGGGGGGGGSGHSRSSSSSSSRRLKSPVNHHNSNNNYQHHPQQQRIHTPPRGGGGYTSSSNNNGVHSPTHPSDHKPVQYQELSPESKARKQAMMSKQQQLQQQQMTQQSSSSSYHTASGTGSSNTLVNMMYTSDGGHSTKTVHTANLTDTNNSSSSNSGGSSSSPLVQGMDNLSLSNQQQQQQSPRNSQKQPPQPRSPPSPRAQLLKKMQNNDEEDWEKAWAEDSESDDDDGGDSSADEGMVGPPPLPIVPSLEPSGGVAFAAAIGAAGGAGVRSGAAGGVGGQTMARTAASLPYRPDMDSGHSSASVQVVPPTAAMHSAFTPTKPQPSQQQKQQQQQKATGQETPPSTIKTPIIQYPPVQPKSQFASPEFPTAPREIEEDARLLQEANDALEGEGDWDSYMRHEEEEVDERPCVDMFDPALRVLGRGSFGRVVLVQKHHGQNTGSLYAMKILRKSHLVRRRQIERTKTERKVLSVLDHPFIMKMYYAFQTTEKLFLVLDYCPGGELFFHLSRYRRFQEPVSRFYAAELLLAIGHLHKNGIIYRDLKPENVLLDAYGHVKLGDFGLAKDGITHPTRGAKSTCGTPEYMAPEVLNQGGHGFCVDYWGLGMILYEMMTGLPPWYTTDRTKLFRRLRSAPLIFPKEVHFTPHCRACIAGLLEREPRLRLGVMGLRSAMRHEFFYRRINFEALRARQIAAPIRPCEGWRQFNQNSRNGSNVGSENGNSEHQSYSTGDGVVGGGWHSAGPSLDSATMGGISAEALDVATANFDDSFRRMPIETEDYEKQQQAAGHPPISEQELNAQTFRGFTFDGDLPLEEEGEQMHYRHQHPSAGRPPPSSGGQHGSGGGGIV